MTIMLHQACIDDIGLELNNNSNTYVIDAMLVNPDSMHYVKIYLANGAPIDSRVNFSVKLTNEDGEIVTFEDSQKLLAEINESNDSILHEKYGYDYFYDYERMNYNLYKLDSILGHIYYRYQKGRINEVVYNESLENKSKIFIARNYNLEVGKAYTLCVTIDGEEHCATEKLLPPLEVKSVTYQRTERFKSIGEGYHDLRIPVFEVINNSKESKYFLVSIDDLNSLLTGSIRLFSTENMSDTIKELQLNEYNYDPAYSIWDDDWYIDLETNNHALNERMYNFYPISKDNYEYYKIIERQIRTDGGVYNPTATTPYSNFSGDNIYGQFIITSESRAGRFW